MAASTRASQSKSSKASKRTSKPKSARVSRSRTTKRIHVATSPSPPSSGIAETISSKTVTPYVVEETTPPLSQAEIRFLRQAMAGMQSTHTARPRVSKSHSRRRRHRRYDSDSSTDSEDGDYDSDSSTDPEDNDANKVSFLHQEGNKPFLTLHERYRAVDIKYFKQIFFGTFRADSLAKLSHTVATIITASKDNEEVSGMVQLLRCMEVYSQAVCAFAHPSIESSLQRAFSKYRSRLADLSTIRTFSSVREYNRAFLNTRILYGQDDPTAWATY